MIYLVCVFIQISWWSITNDIIDISISEKGFVLFIIILCTNSENVLPFPCLGASCNIFCLTEWWSFLLRQVSEVPLLSCTEIINSFTRLISDRAKFLFCYRHFLMFKIDPSYSGTSIIYVIGISFLWSCPKRLAIQITWWPFSPQVLRDLLFLSFPVVHQVLFSLCIFWFSCITNELYDIFVLKLDGTKRTSSQFF